MELKEFLLIWEDTKSLSKELNFTSAKYSSF